MSYRKFRWSRVYESSEEELLALFQARNITGERVHAEADAILSEQQTKDGVAIWCAEGSLTVKTESGHISLQPGDALRIEAGAFFLVQPGIASCTYYLSA